MRSDGAPRERRLVTQCIEFAIQIRDGLTAAGVRRSRINPEKVASDEAAELVVGSPLGLVEELIRGRLVRETRFPRILGSCARRAAARRDGPRTFRGRRLVCCGALAAQPAVDRDNRPSDSYDGAPDAEAK